MELADFDPYNPYNPRSLEYMLNKIPHDKKFRSMNEQAQTIENVLKNGICQPDILHEFSVRNYQVDRNKLSKTISEHNYDHIVHDSTTCILESMLKPQDFIGDVNLVASGSIGDVYITDAQVIIVKKERDLRASPIYLEYEAFIGFAINSLRSKIPNFIHTYGILYCSPNMYDKHKLCSTFGSIDQKFNRPNLLLEYIPNGKSITEIAFTHSERIGILLQIVNALNVANKELGFVHYDLHLGNVMIVELQQPITIPLYLRDGQVKYLVTRYLVKILDYGISRVRLNGTSFHAHDYESVGINGSNNYLYDIVKFITSWSYESQYKSLLQDQHDKDFINKAFSAVELPQQFSLEYFLLGSFDALHALSRYCQTSLTIDLDQYIANVLNIFESDLDFLVDERNPTIEYAICDNLCYDWKTYISQVLNTDKRPQTIMEFISAMQSLDDKNTTYSKNIKSFLLYSDINDIYQEEKHAIIDNIQEQTAILREINGTFRRDIYLILLKSLDHIIKDKQWISAVTWMFSQTDIVETFFQDSYVEEQIASFTTINNSIKTYNELLRRIVFNIPNASSEIDRAYRDILRAYIYNNK